MEWKVDVFIDYREKYIKEYFEKKIENMIQLFLSKI